MDSAPPPLGLRDLPIIPASEGDWARVQEKAVAGVEQALRAKPPSATPPGASPADASAPGGFRGYVARVCAGPEKAACKSQGRGGLGPLFWMIAILVLIAAGDIRVRQAALRGIRHDARGLHRPRRRRAG
ncbi:MAG: hypothetical protein WDN76_06635 [Alphaproteobacteria bacterium]